MKPKTLNSIVITLLTLSGPLYGQSFDAGSDGSLGDVVIAAGTNLDLPPDGKLNFKSLTVNGGATLGFNRNAKNTPVYVLSQTEIVINGTINVDGGSRAVNTGGAGGPGGFDGGKPGFGTEAPPGDGYGPGGGPRGDNSCADSPGIAEGGAYGTTRSSFAGSTYGNVTLIPLVGGSGGGGGANDPDGGGGGGGGTIMLAANNRVAVNGTIFSRGGNGGFCINGGSGGAIRLVSFKVEGSGTLDAHSQGNGGQGRIRIDTVIRTNLNFNMFGASTIGGNLLVFPPTVSSLAVIQAAGNNIPEGSNPVVFTLPFGSSTNRTIRIQARDFGRNLPIRVTLTPDAGPKQIFDAAVDNTTVNPAVVDVPVTVPVNTLVTVHCWTR
jgi:hypothetical protein